MNMKRTRPLVFKISLVAALLGATAVSLAQQPKVAAPKPTVAPPAPIEWKPYTETIAGTKVSFDMVPLPAGKFSMGSPAKEKGRNKDESPQHDVDVHPFFMSKTEATWEAYHLFLDLGIKASLNPTADSNAPDALTYPTPPYADETFGYGKGKQPIIAVTWHAAMEFARWISTKTGKTYRLPTEAEWEYACRAGTTTAYSFGDSPAKLGDYAFFDKNAKKRPNLVGQKLPNPWGLFDMHGNVSEWTLDQYAPDSYAKAVAGTMPFTAPNERRFPHIARGGGWKEGPAGMRCAARRFSQKVWSKQDPQNPQSIWWHTEATEVGFRLVYVPQEYPNVKAIRSKMTPESAY